MVRGAVVVVPPKEAADLFINANPNLVFANLEEIGHGNFGAVYQAITTTGEVVAVKKMTVKKGFASEEWNDIHREILVMRHVQHPNIVAYKGCYREQLEIWLALEFCEGSCLDVMEAIKSGLAEPEISCITRDVLKALDYIHTDGKMHRDIKAGNILLAPNGGVKLADFGSASMKSPANSFSGTPFWMAPELIMAMEDGTYTSSVDLWSLGITVIELATMTPPLFSMNAMSALYHIPQKEPARLEGEKWSASIKSFVSRCLQKDPDARPPASELLADPFVAQELPPSTLLRLVKNATNPELIDGNRKALEEAIESTRQIMRSTSLGVLPKLRNELPAVQETHSESSGGSAAAPVERTPITAGSPLSPRGRSAHTPETARKKQKQPMSPTNRVQESATPPGGSSPWSSPRLERAKSKRKKTTLGPLQEARSNRKENNAKDALENEMIVFQLKQMKKIRKSQTKMLEALDAKQAPELTQLESKNSKELDSLTKAHEKETEKRASRHKVEIDAWDKEHAVEQKKCMKQLKQSREKALAEATKASAVALKQSLQAHKRETANKPKGERKFLEHELRGYHEDGRRRSDKALLDRLDAEAGAAEGAFRAAQLESRQTLQLSHLMANAAQVQAQSRLRSEVADAHASAYQKMRLQQHQERSAVIAKNLTTLCEMELNQAANLARDALRGLEKRQAVELKSQPKHLKGSEADMKKQYKHTLKKTEEKFRSSFSSLRKMPADSRGASLRRHNAEKSEQLLALESGHHASISDMRKEATSVMASRHREELEELARKNDKTLLDLQTYQTARFEVHEQQSTQASNQLDEELEEEAAELAAFIETERALVAEMNGKIPQLQQKHQEAKALLLRTSKTNSIR